MNTGNPAPASDGRGVDAFALNMVPGKIFVWRTKSTSRSRWPDGQAIDVPSVQNRGTRGQVAGDGAAARHDRARPMERNGTDLGNSGIAGSDSREIPRGTSALKFLSALTLFELKK